MRRVQSKLYKENRYDLVVFEIVGFCNAKCPWCITGNRSINESSYPSKFIQVNDFENAINTLLEGNIICPGECFMYLCSWGEPMLHPELNMILRILNKNNIYFALSTNASKIVHFDNDVLENLYELRFSMPGFSQSSYDRIHGFSFDRILRNIYMLIENIEKEGASVHLTMAYHLYQFNIGEIGAAAKFCKENGIEFAPYVAYLNDFNLLRSYVDKSISQELLGKMSKDLLLYYVDELIAKAPKNYECPQFNFLAIDEYCNVLTCCLLPKDHPEYSLGNIFALSYNEIQKGKRSQSVCIDCIKSGISYWVHNSLVPDFMDDYNYILEEEQRLQQKDLELQKRDNVINALLDSKSLRLGRALTRPARYIVDRLK